MEATEGGGCMNPPHGHQNLGYSTGALQSQSSPLPSPSTARVTR